MELPSEAGSGVAEVTVDAVREAFAGDKSHSEVSILRTNGEDRECTRYVMCGRETETALVEPPKVRLPVSVLEDEGVRKRVY